MKRILVVEDEESMIEIYKDIFLGTEGRYEINYVNNARDALARVKEEICDLIITDVVMQPMSGDTFFAYVRGNTKTAKLPIIVVSVLKLGIFKGKNKIGNTRYLSKPITKEKLLKEIEESLHNG